MSLTTQMIAGLLSGVIDHPDDFDRLLILADACEDEGEGEAAECLRWCASERKRPKGQWWFNGELASPDRFDKESDLPGVLYKCLNGYHQGTNYSLCYPSPVAAWLALWRAWPKAKGKGWQP